MTHRRLRTTLAVLAALALPATASAQNVKWGTVGNWFIGVDKPTRSCTMTQIFSRGSGLTVMFDRGVNRFVIGINNPAWDADIVHGKKYQLRVNMDGSEWKGTFVADVQPTGRAYLIATHLTTEFLHDVMKRNSIRFYAPNGETLTTLPLAGSWAAMLELIECQRAMNGAES